MDETQNDAPFVAFCRLLSQYVDKSFNKDCRASGVCANKTASAAKSKMNNFTSLAQISLLYFH